MRKIDKIIIHCSATPPNMDIGAAEIRRWHVQDNGWADIGYHFVVRRDGTIEDGRPVGVRGAHTAAGGGNNASIGVCVVGGVRRQGGKLVTENNFTPEQWAALDALIFNLRRAHTGITQIFGHRDFDRGKDCPSFSVKDKAIERGWLKRKIWA